MAGRPRMRVSVGMLSTITTGGVVSKHLARANRAAGAGSAGGGVMVDLHIRDATAADLPAIVDVYNQSIPAGWSTADTQPVAVADRVEWFRKFDPAKRPIWVAEADGSVVAVAYLSSFYGGRPAYDATAEVSLYIATAYQRRGIGRGLKRWVIEQRPRLGVATLLSMHFDHNEATPRINRSLG